MVAMQKCIHILYKSTKDSPGLEIHKAAQTRRVRTWAHMHSHINSYKSHRLVMTLYEPTWVNTYIYTYTLIVKLTLSKNIILVINLKPYRLDPNSYFLGPTIHLLTNWWTPKNFLITSFQTNTKWTLHN